MSAADDYVREIRKLEDHAALMAFWQRVLRGEEILGFPAGKAFEYLILRAFEVEQVQVTWPYEVALEGQVVEQVDGAIHLPVLSALIEAKDYRSEIEIKALLELGAKLRRRPPTVFGIVFSKRGFTPPALTLARYQIPQRVLLWRGEELTVALARRNLVAALLTKYRRLVEMGLPDLNICWE